MTDQKGTLSVASDANVKFRTCRCFRRFFRNSHHHLSSPLSITTASPVRSKNAIDFLFREWNNKAAGFISYGSAGGARAVEQLRLVMAEVQIATIRNQVLLSLFTDFEEFSVFKPAP